MERIGCRWLIIGVLIAVLLCASATPPAQAQGSAIRVVQQNASLHEISLPSGLSAQEFASPRGIAYRDSGRSDQLTAMLRSGGGGMYPPGPPLQGCYVVRCGDTLAGIATRFNSDVWCIARANGISNPDLIYVGQCLRIPGPGCWSPCAPGPTEPFGCGSGWHPLPPPPPPPPPVPPPCPSCDPCAAATASGQWCASFYANRDLAGPPIVRRMDADVSFNWGYGSPGHGVPPDNFSVRWTRTLGLPAGTYRITARSDDGVRVYIDSTLVISGWQVQSATTASQDVILGSSAVRTVVVEYFDASGAAEIQVTIQSVS